MLLLGDAVENITDIYTLTSDVSQNGSILLEVPNTTFFYSGFKYQVSGNGGTLTIRIGDISNNIDIDILHTDSSKNNISIKQSNITVLDTSFNNMFYDISDVPLDIKLINNQLNVTINTIDISCNIILDDIENNVMTITASTDVLQNTYHIIKDIFFDPITVLQDDLYLERGIYANKYVNVDYNDIINKPWINSNNGIEFNGTVGIGSVLPLQTESYDLGSTDRRWRDLYLSGTTIDLSGTQISRHTNGNLMVHDISGTMFGITIDHIDLNGTLITKHTDGSVVLGDGSGNRMAGRFADVTASGNLDVSGNIIVAGNISASGNLDFTGSLLQNGQPYVGTQWDTSGNSILYNGNVGISGDLQCSNLTVNGTTTTINSSTVTVSDPIITLGSDAFDNKDRGIEFKYDAKRGFFGYDSSTEAFIFLKDASNNSEVFSGTSGLIIGDISGNSSTVTNGVYTTGNQTIAGTKTFSSTITGSVTGNAGTVTNGVYTIGNQTIGGIKTFSNTIIGDISGNSSTVTNGVYTTGDQTIGGIKTFSSTITGNVSGNAGTVTNGVYTIGNQTISGTKTFSNTIIGDISGNSSTVTNGVYTTGNQTIAGTKTFSSTITGNVSGNAGTATTLQTARNINGVSFNGSSDITVNGTAININDGWIRYIGDAAHVRMYGNSRQMLFRTDGTTQYSDNGAYPFVWLYGGESSGNRQMILNDSGQLWCSNYGWLHDKFYYNNSNATFNQCFANDWFRPNNNCGIYWQTYGRGLWAVDSQGSDYGSVSTYGSGKNNWEGYSIAGRYVFMSSSSNDWGIYNDIDNRWCIYGNRNYVGLRYDNSEKIITQSYGVYVYGDVRAYVIYPMINTNGNYITAYVDNIGFYNMNGYANGYIENDQGSWVGNIDFTGQHRVVNNNNINTTHEGLIVIAIGTYTNFNKDKSPSINEALPDVELATLANDKRVFGVISSKEDENDEYRKYVTGSYISLAKKTDEINRLIINSLGEGSIWVCNINGNLENGDYITSSIVPGYGMKQNDDLFHNYTVAKITCDCFFNSLPQWIITRNVTFNNITYIAAFVGCTYHCG